MRARALRWGSLDGLTDGELIERTRDGDHAAFSTLADRHWDRLVHLCRQHLGGDAHQAEDVAQECLVKLLAAVGRDHRPLQPRAWLSVVARHACIDVHRGRRADPVGDVPDRGIVDDDRFDVDPILGEAWDSLTERHRTVLHHRELMGLSYDEIAAAMEISDSAVETLLFRARAALRRNYVRAGGQLLGCGLFGVGLMRAIDGGSSPDLAAHLSACSSCSDALGRLGATAELLRSGGAPLPDTALTLVDRARSWISSALSGPASALAGPAVAAAPTVGAAITAAVMAVGPLQAAHDPQPVPIALSPAPAAEVSPPPAPAPAPSDGAPGTGSDDPAASPAQPDFALRNPHPSAMPAWTALRPEWTGSQPWTSPHEGTTSSRYEWDPQWSAPPEASQSQSWPEDPDCEHLFCDG